VKISEIYKIFLKSTGITTDTREIKTNQIFFAINGENFNGNKFAKQAIEKGALTTIIDQKKYFINNKKTILVNNSIETLQKLANFHRQQFNIPVIGITGTNGKTTTKELINAVIKQKYNTIYTKGNLNNHIGVPITLLNINTKTEIAIIEMGANHKKEIEFLCNIANPNYGIITNIGKAHIKGFGSLKNIIKTKTELYKHIENNNGTIIINNDDKILKQNINNIKNIFTYGIENNNYCIGRHPVSNPFLELKIIDNNKKINIKTNLVGNYNFYNVLAAYCFGKVFNIESNKIKYALENYKPDNMRSQLKKTKHNTLLIDAYNANPTSMNNAIDNLYKINVKNKVLIIGDMLELGKISENEHKNIINKIIELKFKNVFLVGEIFKKINKSNLLDFINTKELINFLEKNPIKNSFILIKGSRGIKLEEIIKYL